MPVVWQGAVAAEALCRRQRKQKDNEHGSAVRIEISRYVADVDKKLSTICHNMQKIDILSD